MNMSDGKISGHSVGTSTPGIIDKIKYGGRIMKVHYNNSDLRIPSEWTWKRCHTWPERFPRIFCRYFRRIHRNFTRLHAWGQRIVLWQKHEFTLLHAWGQRVVQTLSWQKRICTKKGEENFHSRRSVCFLRLLGNNLLQVHLMHCNWKS